MRFWLFKTFSISWAHSRICPIKIEREKPNKPIINLHSKSRYFFFKNVFLQKRKLPLTSLFSFHATSKLLHWEKWVIKFNIQVQWLWDSYLDYKYYNLDYKKYNPDYKWHNLQFFLYSKIIPLIIEIIPFIIQMAVL